MQLDKITTLADGLDHPEGVALGPDGVVYAGGEAGQLYRITAAGEPEEIANTGGFILGLTLDADARIYACDTVRPAVVVVDKGKVDVYSNGTAERPMVNPNWPVFDTEGNLYVTDSGSFGGDNGCIFKVAPGGRAEIWSTAVTNFPNGSCLAEDGSALYVIESLLPGVKRIPINADGSASPPEVVVEIPGTVPDGIAVDSAGTLFVACYRPDRLYTIPAGGDAEVLADDPQGVVLAAPTNVAFIGAQLDRVVVGSLGRWHLGVFDVEVPGVALNYPSFAS